MFEPQEPVAQRRIALYSHDAMGLGHLRRNLAIGAALVQQPGPTEVLLLCGSREVAAFTIPAGVDCVTLPALSKSPEGRYHPRSLGGSLADVVALRSRIIRAAIEAFEPDLLVVDKLARGVCRELDATLDLLGSTTTRCVLGLRDVLDAPQRTRQEWDAAATTEVIDQHYARVWVYGDPSVFDPIQAYGLPGSIAARTDHTGYLGHGRPVGHDPSGPEVEGTIDALCLLGGGQDGVDLADAFVEALPQDRRGVVVTGPYMSRSRRAKLSRAARRHPHCRVLEMVDGCERLIARAGCTVSMGATTRSASSWPPGADRSSCPGSDPGRSSWCERPAWPSSTWSTCSTRTCSTPAGSEPG